MVPVCHAAQMSSQVWKTFHVCHLVIITSQETTTTMSSKNSGCNSPLFSLSIIYFSYKNVRKCKRKKTLIVISQREDFGLNPRDSLFNIMNDKDKQQFLPFKKLKSSKRLIFLLEKWLKSLIKCSCFVLCTYIIMMFDCQRGGLPLDIENKQTNTTGQQVYWSESQQVFQGDYLWEVCCFHYTVLREKWDRDGWRRLEDKRRKKRRWRGRRDERRGRWKRENGWWRK